MKQQFQLLKDSVSLTKKSLETIANDSDIEKALLLATCSGTLKVSLDFIDLLEKQVQTYLSERNALLTFIKDKGLVNEFWAKNKNKGTG